MQKRVHSLSDKTQLAGIESVALKPFRIQLNTPVNPIVKALLDAGPSSRPVTDIEFETYWFESQSYTLRDPAKVHRVYRAASCLEFIFTQNGLTDRCLTLLSSLQSDSLFFKGMEEAIEFSKQISKGYDSSTDRDEPMVLAKRRELVVFRIKAEQEKNKRRAQQLKTWTTSLSARFLGHHRGLVAAFLQALSTVEIRFIVIAKGIEIYFPGLGKDLDLYIGIEASSDNTAEQTRVMGHRFTDLLLQAGFVVSMVVGSETGNSIVSQFQVKHPDHQYPLDIAIRPLPPALSAVLKLLETEWVFDVSSGFIPLRLDTHGEVEAGALMAPQSIFEQWIYNPKDTLLIHAIKAEPLQVHELAFLCKICCKLQIDLSTGESAKVLELAGRTVQFRLSPLLLEQLYVVEQTPEAFSKIFFKILECYFSVRSLEFHTFFYKHHWIERLFPEASLDAEVLESLQRLLANALPGLAYFVFLAFHFLRKKEQTPAAMERAFCELLLRHCGYDRRDLLLIFRSLSQHKIIEAVLKDSFVEAACKSLSLSRLNPSAPEFKPSRPRKSQTPGSRSDKGAREQRFFTPTVSSPWTVPLYRSKSIQR